MHESLANACRAVLLAAISVVAVACHNSSPPPTPTAATAISPAGGTRESSRVKAPAIPLGAALVSDVHDLVPNGECRAPGPSSAAAIAAAGSALIPLKVGLTLSSTWKAYPEDYEHECLLQVSQIDARGILTTSSCPIGAQHKTSITPRHLCWTDVLNSYLYITQGGLELPETLVGSLQFSLSVDSFASLKTRGEFHHRYIDLDSSDRRLVRYDVEGALISDGPATFKVIINDKVVEVPTIEANYVNHKTNDIIRIKVLDEARFPVVLDYYSPSMHSFFITYTKISYPTADQVEQHLAVDKHTDVYGIYFDFASDSLRPESEPVLREIADALKAHPDWTLIINGHTDNVGGDVVNLDLSRRRAAAVRKALVDRYMIEDSRLTTNGFGASQPKESNDSDRGRALNRRVELVRP
jgi:flagellar motor protein MotB